MRDPGERGSVCFSHVSLYGLQFRTPKFERKRKSQVTFDSSLLSFSTKDDCCRLLANVIADI